MIYIYNAEVLASLRNRSLACYSEYNILHSLLYPPLNRPWPGSLNGLFYYYIHEIYDPLFLWNITEIGLLKIELGNNRFVGRSLKAQLTSEERWLSTILVSPVPWNFVLADIRITSLDKTLDIDFLRADQFNGSEVFEKGCFFNAVIKPYLKFPKIFDKFFGPNDKNTYDKHAEDMLSYSYILKNKDIDINVLGNKNNPPKEYDINDYGGVLDTISAMFADAEKEIQ